MTHVGTRPFVGRRDELAVLCAVLAGPGPALACVGGEPGIGKTRLVEEALRACDVRTLRCPSFEWGGSPPLAPFVRALQMLATGLETELADLARPLGVVGRVAPELADRASVLVTQAPEDAGRARFELFEAIADITSWMRQLGLAS